MDTLIRCPHCGNGNSYFHWLSQERFSNLSGIKVVVMVRFGCDLTYLYTMVFDDETHEGRASWEPLADLNDLLGLE